EVAMLAFGVYFAYASGDPKAAGNVVAIFLLTPSLMTPIQGLSAYILMAGNAWPAIDTVNKMMESRARRDKKSGTLKVAGVEANAQGNPLDQDFAGGRRLSGGQKKLLALTRCLLRNPSILFLDEPTVGMDNVEKFSMLEIIKNALRGHTVMVVDHDLRWLMPF